MAARRAHLGALLAALLAGARGAVGGAPGAPDCNGAPCPVEEIGADPKPGDADEDPVFFDEVVANTGPRTPVAAIVLFLFWIAPVALYVVNDYYSRTRKRTVQEGEEQRASSSDLNLPVIASANQHVVLAASLEHSLPHLPKGKAIAGGLGKVMDLVARHHPTDIYMVHPMVGSGDKVDYSSSDRVEEDSLRFEVDGRRETVRVFRYTFWPEGSDGMRVEFLMLSHPLFEARTKESIYPNPMSRRAVLRFFSMWNQAVGALLVRYKVDVFHCPDFHTAVAPWYAVPKHPGLRVLVILHNAEYQGGISTDMIRGDRLDSMARIWNLPVGIVQKHLVQDGRFNMLKAALDFVMEYQKGVGICAVSEYYAQECHCTYSILWSVPRIQGLDNPMLEDERAKLSKDLVTTKAESKREIQEQLKLNVDPGARIFVSLGRLVRQKGIDLIADIAPWLLETFPSAQVIIIGPIGDGFGHYAATKLEALSKDPRFRGRVFACCEFMRVADNLKFAADFCLMPSRDEPFGYVDIEFAWRGAVLVGAQAGGLGKVPGFYYVAQNRENTEVMRKELKTVITSAMEADESQLRQMAQKALECDFPLDEWQRKLMWLYSDVLRTCGGAGDELHAAESPAAPKGSGAPEVEMVTRERAEPAGAASAGAPQGGEARRGSVSRDLMPRATVTSDRQSLQRGSVDMINVNMEVPSSFLSVAPLDADAEFLTQELSEEEIAEKIQDKLRSGFAGSIDEILEEIGGDQDKEKADGFYAEWLLKKSLFGMKNVHWCVSIGYVAIPVSSFLTMTMAREWSARGAEHIPSWILSMRWFKPVFGSGGINAHLLNVILFVTNSLSMAIGGPVWAQLTRTTQPRKLLAAGFLLQLPFVLAILPATPTVVTSLMLVFSSGLVSSCGLLFVVMNFMMSITGDLTQAALRMGNIEMARYCASWLAAGYVFLASPSSVAGTATVAMPIKITLVMLPLAMAVAGLMAVPGGLLLHAPGPYRDDMLPGWDLGKLANRKTFLWLSISDCLGGLAAFPASCYLSWWLANGWEQSGLVWVSCIFGFVLAGGVYAWGQFLATALQTGCTPLIASAVVLGPPSLLMAIVLEEVSTFTFFGTSYYAMAMCLLALLLEGVRSSAMWTVKMRVLNSRWRLLSYGTIFTSVQQLCCALSPFLCEFIARRHGASFLTTNQKELADAIVVSLAPIGILQFFAQALALPFVQKEFGMTVQSERGYSNTLVMRLFRRSPLATSLATGGLLALGLWLVQRSLVSRRPPFTPYHRCSSREHTCVVLETRENVDFAKPGGGGFGTNEYGQYTTAKFNCRLLAHDHVQANSFMFSEETGQCVLLTCSEQDVPHGQRLQKQDSPGSRTELWSSFCDMSGHDLAMVHLFEWTWSDVGRECEDHLGPAGYDVVVVSPAQEHVVGDKWFDRYQPVSEKLETRSGNRGEFIQMVKRCKRAGVEVMLDVILNHMASTHIQTPKSAQGKTCGRNQETETETTSKCRGFAGTEFGERRFNMSGDGEIKFFQKDFHHYPGNLEANCHLPPWTDNRHTCDLNGLPDLDQEQVSVRHKLQRFLLDVFEIGITHLRLDAAAHIYPSSMGKILEPFPWDYLLLEVYPAPLYEGQTKQYLLAIGALTDFSYGSRVAGRMFDWYDASEEAWRSNADRFKNLLYMSDLEVDCDDGMCISPCPREKATIFLDNHDQQRFAWNERYQPSGQSQAPEVVCKWDRQRGEVPLCRPIYKHGQAYLLMMLYELAFPYGSSVRIMSSYFWDDFGSGPPGLREDSLTDKPTSVHDDSGGCRTTPTETPLNETEDREDEKKWICEHRWRGVAALVRFRQVVRRVHGLVNRSAVTVRHVEDRGEACEGGGCIAFGLGNVSFVALHRGFNGLTQIGSREGWDMAGVATGLPSGSYCNLAMWEGPLHEPSPEKMPCPGAPVQIGTDGAVIHGVVASGSAIVILKGYMGGDEAELVI